MNFKQAFHKVFENSPNLFWPFSHEFDYGLVLYPTRIVTPHPDQFQAIIQFTENIGEHGFWMTKLEVWRGERISEDNTFWFGIDGSYEKCAHIMSDMTEHGLYSENGTWGIYLTADHFGVFASSSTNARIFQKYYPKWREDFADFASDLYSKDPNGSIYNIFARDLKLWQDLRDPNVA